MNCIIGCRRHLVVVHLEHPSIDQVCALYMSPHIPPVVPPIWTIQVEVYHPLQSPWGYHTIANFSQLTIVIHQ